MGLCAKNSEICMSAPSSQLHKLSHPISNWYCIASATSRAGMSEETEVIPSGPQAILNNPKLTLMPQISSYCARLDTALLTHPSQSILENSRKTAGKQQVQHRYLVAAKFNVQHFNT